MKKNIVFLADSRVDLFELYEKLKLKFNVIWVVYNRDVYQDLKKENIEKIYFFET